MNIHFIIGILDEFTRALTLLSSQRLKYDPSIPEDLAISSKPLYSASVLRYNYGLLIVDTSNSSSRPLVKDEDQSAASFAGFYSLHTINPDDDKISIIPILILIAIAISFNHQSSPATPPPASSCIAAQSRSCLVHHPSILTAAIPPPISPSSPSPPSKSSSPPSRLPSSVSTQHPVVFIEDVTPPSMSSLDELATAHPVLHTLSSHPEPQHHLSGSSRTSPLLSPPTYTKLQSNPPSSISRSTSPTRHQLGIHNSDHSPWLLGYRARNSCQQCQATKGTTGHTLGDDDTGKEVLGNADYGVLGVNR
ncbi:hypothetical protein CVT24_012255 [Panaeolus cyanescens]|uniref:Uncharacterized protein n=1 Tax=Panaeolus cyanescens TaxID=181874 RepID=A0A409WDT7_9AGAR|nr:hypothetical protein CVT24_012255 [Panaeolus cyanescens]